MTIRLAVAIPCYKVTDHVLSVIEAIGPEVQIIYAVDDACPDHSGQFIKEKCQDTRVRVITHDKNKGVGGAMVSAYRAALADGMDIVVKIDGDGQMNPKSITHLIHPILQGKADYTKGTRFYGFESLQGMPKVRVIGNAGLSFINKLSSGYWPIMDPTNGFTAIHVCALKLLPLNKIEQRFFFESDMLYHLNLVRAVVRDVPFDAVYANEKSNLKIGRTIPEFFFKHVKRFFKRYVYTYLLRDFNLGSVYSLCGGLMSCVGLIFGAIHWIRSSVTGELATSGTVMLAAFLSLVGIQLLIAFLHHDVTYVPTEPLLSDYESLPVVAPLDGIGERESEKTQA